MAVALTSLGLGAGLDIYNAVRANQKEGAIRNQISQLNSVPRARYSVQPGMLRYGQIALNDINNPQGYSGAETGQFNQMLAKSGQGAYVNGTNVSGGNQSKAILANNLGYQTSAINNFAAGDAGLRRSNRLSGLGRYGTFAQTEQGVNDRNVSQDINYRMQLERALGGAASHQSDVQSQTYNNFGNDLMGAGSMLLAGGNGYSNSTGNNSPFRYGSTNTGRYNIGNRVGLGGTIN